MHHVIRLEKLSGEASVDTRTRPGRVRFGVATGLGKFLFDLDPVDAGTIGRAMVDAAREAWGDAHARELSDQAAAFELPGGPTL
jgi:hypothetical protein